VLQKVHNKFYDSHINVWLIYKVKTFNQALNCYKQGMLILTRQTLYFCVFNRNLKNVVKGRQLFVDFLEMFQVIITAAIFFTEADH
jgi:hypothetical protein